MSLCCFGKKAPAPDESTLLVDPKEQRPYVPPSFSRNKFSLTECAYLVSDDAPPMQVTSPGDAAYQRFYKTFCAGSFLLTINRQDLTQITTGSLMLDPEASSFEQRKIVLKGNSSASVALYAVPRTRGSLRPHLIATSFLNPSFQGPKKPISLTLCPIKSKGRLGRHVFTVNNASQKETWTFQQQISSQHQTNGESTPQSGPAKGALTRSLKDVYLQIKGWREETYYLEIRQHIEQQPHKV